MSNRRPTSPLHQAEEHRYTELWQGAGEFGVVALESVAVAVESVAVAVESGVWEFEAVEAELH